MRWATDRALHTVDGVYWAKVYIYLPMRYFRRYEVLPDGVIVIGFDFNALDAVGCNTAVRFTNCVNVDAQVRGWSGPYCYHEVVR